MPADPKQPKSVRDPGVFKLFHALGLPCLVCGTFRFVNAAHVLGRGAGGDDVMADLVPLCGGGSGGCHGAYDNGHAYVRDGRRITQQDVRREVAAFLRSDHGREHREYLRAKLGVGGSREFIRRLAEGRQGVAARDY